MSIRQWLEQDQRKFRSTSPDIGYLKVRYANGIFVAVGYQKDFPPSDYPTAGGAVTAAGCSWSPDGINWTDSVLPFSGTSMIYADAQYDGTGRWMAGSCEYVTNSRKTYVVFSTDNARTWGTPFVYAGEELYGLHGSNGKHFLSTLVSGAGRERRFQGGTQAALLGIQSTWTGSAALAGTPDYIAFTSGAVPRIWNSGGYLTPSGWTGWWTVAGVNLADPTTLYRPYDVISGADAFYALVSDQPNGPAGVNQRGRDIWRSPFGGVWTKTATLPFVAGGLKGPYYQLAYASEVGIYAAVGDGVLMCSRNGTNWTEEAIPAGAWRGIASNGTDFVVVSANGDRLKISGVSLEGRVS